MTLPSGTTERISERMMLTPKREAFAQHYATSVNAAEAYRHAFNVKPSSKPEGVAASARALMAVPEVAARIEELRAIASAAAAATRDPETGVGTLTWALDRLTSMATADPRELIGLRVGACRHCWGEAHAYHWRMREYVEAVREAERLRLSNPAWPLPDASGGLDFNATRAPHPECPECHGEGLERVVPRDTNKLSEQALLLYGGVKRKRDGSIEIVMADRTKALEMAVRMLGGFHDNVKVGGAIGALVKIIDPAMSAEDAAKAYRDMCAGIAV